MALDTGARRGRSDARKPASGLRPRLCWRRVEFHDLQDLLEPGVGPQRIECGLVLEETHEPVSFGDTLFEQVERLLDVTESELDEPMWNGDT